MIYERIKKLAKEQGISINALEIKIGIAKGSLCKIDIHKPSSAKMKLLADELKTTVDYLMTGKESRYSDENADLIADIMLDNYLLEVMKLYQKLKKEQQKHVVDLMVMLDKKGE
jgi:transcriptional regulator with XRE-family HTH domain